MTRLESIQNDTELIAELQRRVLDGYAWPKAGSLGIRSGALRQMADRSFAESLADSLAPGLEAVILDFLRPCLIIKEKTFEIAPSDTWKARLEPQRKLIESRIPAVGRIEFEYHPRLKWGGTGWLIAPNFIVTNRHVAAEFASKKDKTIGFTRNALGGLMAAKIDFGREYQDPANEFVREVLEVIYLADDGQPDIAILKISAVDLPFPPIPILTGPLKEKQELVLIGYPAYDPIRNPLKPEDVTRLFTSVDMLQYKRLSPGQILNDHFAPGVFTHDATTLGGNSGSVVLDLKTGHAVGLHFSGVFHDANFAVNAGALLDAIAATRVQVPAAQAPIPIPAPVDQEDLIDRNSAERRPEDYTDREGYVESFLGRDAEVPLPIIKNDTDILKFGTDGKESVLKYLHFSVVMSASRRMCVYSAVNIDGGQSRKTKRPGWLLDPRIPKRAQVIKECYGNPPLFSRGHMTRREDPAWGTTPEEATRGNADSMHVTNTVPQIQPFNAGIWNNLEDYALQNARDDKMHISVITGPFFTGEDKKVHGVFIPVTFWKIIVFIHDKTGQLSATGYILSQESFLTTTEFVYGGFETFQTSIRSIEARAGIDFGPLGAHDPYRGKEVAPTPLADPTQIVFV